MSYLGKYEQRATNIKRFDVTSSTSDTHTLTWVPVNEQSLFVTINGVKQQEDAYSVSGAILTLTDALISTDKMEVIGIQDVGVGMVPADGVVKNVHINDSAAIAKTKLASLDIVNADVNASAGIVGSKLADNAITLAKLEDGTQGDILYYGASGAPARLGFGTSGFLLKTQGTGANPVWTTNFSASGGLESTYSGYKAHTFTSSGIFTVNGTSVDVDYLVVAGGGGGNSGGTAGFGGGGGAGGFRTATTQTLAIGSYTVTVGAGGSVATDGSDSTFNSFTATGGGYGGPKDGAGSDGGSGGGGGGDSASSGGSGNTPVTSPSQGNDGGGGKDTAPEGGGGGGGAGAVGHDGITDGTAAGGVGSQNLFKTGSNIYYSGGGGGSLGRPDLGGDYTTAVGGNGGGGAGGQRGYGGEPAVNGVAGTVNTGGGGGAGDASAAGGSGIVVIRYAV